MKTIKIDQQVSRIIYQNLHTQTIFRKAFNNAYARYETEEQAFRVAWAALKKEYEQNTDGLWIKR